MNELIGYDQLMNLFRELEKVPQTAVTKGARKGANVTLKEARLKAPTDSGNLKKGIIIRPERTRTKGKKVYQVVMDRSLNNIFVKTSAAGKRSYYPASQEYGFFAKNGRYIPGFNFLRGSNASKQNEAKQIMINTMTKEVDKLL